MEPIRVKVVNGLGYYKSWDGLDWYLISKNEAIGLLLNCGAIIA